MDKKVRRYHHLKKKQKEIEQELAELRMEIMNYCLERDQNLVEIGSYKVKIIHQERKEYDDNKVYDALPDANVWRLLSKVDNSKVTSLTKMNVISEEILKDTYTVKPISSLQVEKK